MKFVSEIQDVLHPTKRDEEFQHITNVVIGRDKQTQVTLLDTVYVATSIVRHATSRPSSDIQIARIQPVFDFLWADEIDVMTILAVTAYEVPEPR